MTSCADCIYVATNNKMCEKNLDTEILFDVGCGFYISQSDKRFTYRRNREYSEVFCHFAEVYEYDKKIMDAIPVDEAKFITDELNKVYIENVKLQNENKKLTSMNNELAKALLKDVDFTEEDLLQAWEEYKEELKNKTFSELLEETIGGK